MLLWIFTMCLICHPLPKQKFRFTSQRFFFTLAILGQPLMNCEAFMKRFKRMAQGNFCLMVPLVMRCAKNSKIIYFWWSVWCIYDEVSKLENIFVFLWKYFDWSEERIISVCEGRYDSRSLEIEGPLWNCKLKM